MLKYPNLSSRVMAWILFVGTLLGGGINVYGQTQLKQGIKKERPATPRTKSNEFSNWKINPSMDNATWNKKIKEIEPYILANLILHEGVFSKVYYDGGRVGGTPTIGIGFIINDTEHINFANMVLGRNVRARGFRISWPESKKLALAWNAKKIYPKIKKNFKGNIDAKLFVALVVAAFNKGPNIFDSKNSGAVVRNAVNRGVRGNDLANIYVRAFAGRPNSRWGGIANKYAVLALYFTGHISNQNVVDASAEAPYKLEKGVSAYYKGKKIKKGVDGCLVIYDRGGRPVGFLGPRNIGKMLADIKEHITKGERQHKVRKYMDSGEVKKIKSGILFNSGSAAVKSSVKRSANKMSVLGKKTGNNKINSFNNAIKKLRNHAHSADFDISNAMRSGHDMA